MANEFQELKIRLVLRNGTAAKLAEQNSKLFKGEMCIETDTGLIKVGDGINNWNDLSYVNDIPDIDLSSVTNKCVEVASYDALPSSNCVVGDVGIVKTEIAADKYSYTCYIWNGENWAAADGNYDANNVYFADDLMYTKQIGELDPVPSSGSGTLSAKGKNITTVLTSILAKRKQPTKNEPAVTLSGTQGNRDVEVGTTINVSGATLGASLSAGSYTYGPATGVSATSWSTKVEYVQGKSDVITSGTSESLPYEYSFRLGTDGNTVAVKFSATATHGAGTVANDSFGDLSSPEVMIAAGSKSKQATATYTSYRKMFYGTRTDVDALDSAKIRALTGEKEAAKANNSLTVTIPVGAKRVIIAVPSNRTVTSVKDVNDSSAEIMSSFVQQTVAVEGAEGYSAANYKVYVSDYANPATAANSYKVTIA